MKNMIRTLVLVFVLCFACMSVLAETERGDLSTRFNVPTIEWKGTEYIHRSRLTTVVCMGVAPGEADMAGDVAEFLVLLVVDDNQKLITPVRLESATQIEAADGSMTTLGAVYAIGESPEESCEIVLEEVNALLEDDLIEHYLAIHWDGLAVLDGKSDSEDSFEERARAIRDSMDDVGGSELNRIFVELSDYIETDMKSGATMNLFDKVDRYEVAESIYLPGQWQGEIEESGIFILQHDEVLGAILEPFYMENTK